MAVIKLPSGMHSVAADGDVGFGSAEGFGGAGYVGRLVFKPEAEDDLVTGGEHGDGGAHSGNQLFFSFGRQVVGIGLDASFQVFDVVLPGRDFR